MDIQRNELEQYIETKERFIQVIAKNMHLYGINPSVGRLYGVLYFSDDAMTLDELRDALEMSKTSMSTGVRTLLDLNMVKPVYKRGVRKDLYRSEQDWYKSFTTLFGNRWRNSTESNIDQLEEAKEKLQQLKKETNQAALKEQISIDIERLEYAKDYYEWLMSLIKFIESGEIFNHVPRKQQE